MNAEEMKERTKAFSLRIIHLVDENYWNGNDAAHRRIMYKGAGYADDDIRYKPHIGVANTFTDASPATAPTEPIKAP